MKLPPVIVVQLVHILGPMKGDINEFSDAAITIGRHPSCMLMFPSGLTCISRRHAEIVREGNTFKLIDHSTNGTFVNGKRVGSASLRNGDVLEFAEGGPKVSFLTRTSQDCCGVAESQPMLPRQDNDGPQINPPVHFGQAALNAAPSPVSVREHAPEVSAPRCKTSFVIQFGPTLRLFKELPVTLGRNPSCDFIFTNPAILDRHVQIYFSHDHYWVKDLTGLSMIQINRKPIDCQSQLNPDDLLTLSPRGPIFRFLGEGRLAEVPGFPEDLPTSDRPIAEESRSTDLKISTSTGLFSRLRRIRPPR